MTEPRPGQGAEGNKGRPGQRGRSGLSFPLGCALSSRSCSHRARMDQQRGRSSRLELSPCTCSRAEFHSHKGTGTLQRPSTTSKHWGLATNPRPFKDRSVLPPRNASLKDARRLRTGPACQSSWVRIPAQPLSAHSTVRIAHT